MRCKALLLDLDGVLADTEPIHSRAWEMLLADIGASPIADEWPRLVGTPASEIARYVASTLAPEMSAEELLERKRLVFRTLLPTYLRPFPGLAEELENWRGIPIALSTSGARAEALLMLDMTGLRGVFSAFVAFEDVHRAKPAPDCYLRAAQLLGAPPTDCAAVEDSPRGLQAALAAGTIALAVPPAADSPLPNGAAGAFRSTVEALRWLRE
jgi:HAD superfamily hydrolase (TIGR01509 family)